MTERLPSIPDRKFTEEEFGLILRRAQELQEGRPEAQRPARGGGMSLSEIRQIAGEVGIEPRFVEMAAQTLPAVPEGRHLVFGSPWEWDLQRTVPGELPEEQKGRVLDAIRSVIKGKGEIEVVYGRLEWTWNEDQLGPIQVRVVPEPDATRVEVSAQRAASMGLLFGLSIPIGGFVGAAVISGLLHLEGSAVSVAVASSALGSWAITRAVWRARSEAWQRRLGLLSERVAEAVKAGTRSAPEGK